MTTHTIVAAVVATLATAGVVMLAGVAHAAEIKVIGSPGTKEPYVAPNVIISIDDSGSMNFRLDMESASGASSQSVVIGENIIDHSSGDGSGRAGAPPRGPERNSSCF